MGIVFKAIGFMFKCVYKLIVFTGFWISFIVVFVIDQLIVKMLLGITMTRATRPDVYPIYETAMLIVLAIPVVICTSLNIYKAVTGKSTGLFNTDKKFTNPALTGQLLAAAPEGFIFGRKHKKFVRKADTMDGHILVVGGAGSGKSSCLAIPSLIAWRQRVFAIDIKGELSGRTSDRRPTARVFNPLLDSSPGYNPYYLLRGSRNPAQDAKEIAFALIHKTENVREPFWIDGARNLLTGAILHFFSAGYSFIETIEAVQSTPVQHLVSDIHSSDNQAAKMYINQLVDMDIKTLSGIYAEVSNHIMLFATDQDIRDCLSKPDTITPEDLENGKDIFINIPEDKIEQWKPLLTLIVNQFLKHFERRPDEGATPVLFLLDEFPRLGKVETAITGLATLRSKKITIALFVQSLAQLDAIYGRDSRKVIADNCQYKAILNATDAETQDYFSRLVGTYDKKKKSQSASFEQYTGMGQGTGTSLTTEEKRIIKPEEFAILTDIVLLTPFGFARVERTPYYKTAAFK